MKKLFLCLISLLFLGCWNENASLFCNNVPRDITDKMSGVALSEIRPDVLDAILNQRVSPYIENDVLYKNYEYENYISERYSDSFTGYSRLPYPGFLVTCERNGFIEYSERIY